MVIVSLVAAGVGLAIDAYSERKARREERLRRDSDEQIDGEIRNVAQDADQRRREQDAFNELQSYADFQNDLSSKVLDDLSQEDVAVGYGRPPLPGKGRINYEPRHMNSAQHLRPKQLQWPIIIPQGGTQHGDSYWVRAYPRPLMELGIDQRTFLNFLDSFEVHMKLSTRLEAANVASNSAGIGWRGAPETFSRAIPAAVRVMKAYQKDQKSNSFLNHVNALLFRPHGLFAMIITSRSDSPLQIINVDVSRPQSGQIYEQDVTMSTEDSSTTIPEFNIPRAIYGKASSSSLRESNMDTNLVRHGGYFPEISNPTNTFEGYSESGMSPGQSAFSSLFSTVTKHREMKKEVLRKRIRRVRRPSSRASSGGATSVESPSTRPAGSMRDVRPTWENVNMEAEALYLVIVNDPEFEMPEPSNSMGIYTYPTINNMQSMDSMMQASQSSKTVSSKASFYDPVRDEPRGAPPAYSEA